MTEHAKILRMGRISYLNVLPIYHPIEAGILPCDYELVAGPPALLNDMMAAGLLQVSSCSCFEYGCRPELYYLVRDLAIGSRGPVMSVLLLSDKPFEHLGGHEILISGESHTSVALLRLLMREHYKLDVAYRTGRVTSELDQPHPPEAFLAIGDEALRLRNHSRYPYVLDMAEAWREWTGLPFIFGLWVVSRKACEAGLIKTDPGEILRTGRDWGMSHMDVILDLTAHGCPLNRDELYRYYTEGLVYTLRNEELDGLRLFYEKLASAGFIKNVPKLVFYGE